MVIKWKITGNVRIITKTRSDLQWATMSYNDLQGQTKNDLQ